MVLCSVSALVICWLFGATNVILTLKLVLLACVCFSSGWSVCFVFFINISHTRLYSQFILLLFAFVCFCWLFCFNLIGLLLGLLFFPSPDFSRSILVGTLLPFDLFPQIVSNSLLFWSFLLATVGPATIIISYDSFKRW